jgi:hypothetical protein
MVRPARFFNNGVFCQQVEFAMKRLQLMRDVLPRRPQSAEVPKTAAAVAGKCTEKGRHMTIAGGYKGYVLRLRRDKSARIIEIFGPACSDA